MIFTCIGVFCKLYYLLGKLKTTSYRQVVFYTYRILTLSNSKKTKKTNTKHKKNKQMTGYRNQFYCFQV